MLRTIQSRPWQSFSSTLSHTPLRLSGCNLTLGVSRQRHRITYLQRLYMHLGVSKGTTSAPSTMQRPLVESQFGQSMLTCIPQRTTALSWSTWCTIWPAMAQLSFILWTTLQWTSLNKCFLVWLQRILNYVALDNYIDGLGPCEHQDELLIHHKAANMSWQNLQGCGPHR
jgi:hypothetical protein